MSKKQFLSYRTQSGQAIVLVGLMIIALFGAVGLAVDGGVAYYYNTQAERAAGSAALSGVVFMPGQLTSAQAIPLLSGNDATDRAIAEAAHNGFSMAGANPNNVSVVVSAVAGFENKIQVTVSRDEPTFFMQLFGISSIHISRTAIATYLPPLSLGQPGTQTGSTTAQLGTGGNNYFFMRTEGYATDRQQGDAFTPNPAGGGLGVSTDVHAISGAQGSDPVDPALPDRGGYNYLVNLPNGGYIEVYNAIFAPDNCTNTGQDAQGNFLCPDRGGNNHGGALPGSESWAGAGPSFHNNCDNHISPVSKLRDKCSPGTSYYLHEEDSQDLNGYSGGQKALYSTMEYTVYKVSTPFIRASDSEISKVKVYPIDSTGYYWTPQNCTGACVPAKNYNPINSLGSYVTQSWDAAGNPVNMQTYHSWMDVTNYAGLGDGGTFQRLVTPAPGPLPAGTYRLRVDTLGFDGANPPTNGASPGGQAHKGYAVRVVDQNGQTLGTNSCTGCSVGGWDDMAVYTPIALAVGGHFDLPIFKVPPDYAGQTITMDVYDPGDISGGGTVDLLVLDNTSSPVAVVAPSTINIWDVGLTRTNTGPAVPCTGSGGLTNPPVPCLTQTGSPQQAIIRAATGNVHNYNGHWVRFEVPVPANYAPGLNPANWWWSLRYQISSGVTATDTVTFAVGLKGNPAHLLIS